MKSIKYRIKNIFSKKRIFAISLSAAITKSLPFVWIIWDAILSHKIYKEQKIYPDHLLRFVRFGVGIGWFLGFINPLTAALFLIGDGIYSIFRYRILKVTKNFIEDVPRIIRISVGLLLFPISI
jgi:energy-coupling factor transporter transmembrane protein EcfT